MATAEIKVQGLDELRQEIAAFRAEQALVIEPGDRLVLRFARQLSMAEAVEIKGRLRALLPDCGEPVIVCGVDELGVYRPHQLATRED